MLILLSPSKTQDFSPSPLKEYSIPVHLADSELLIKALRQYSIAQIEQLMAVSSKIATLNKERYTHWHPPFTLANSKQAILAFTGDVYTDIDTAHYAQEDFAFADQHLRILSGLYGLLRPLDLIQPYRLEMKTKLPNPRGKDLYRFWHSLLAENINKTGQKYVLNLASEEYFSAINKDLTSRVITPIFKEYKNNGYTIIGLFAKRARGTMTDFIIKNRITDPQALQDFTAMGYTYRPTLSNRDHWVFARGD